MILEYLAILQQVWDLVQQKQWRKDGQRKKRKQNIRHINTGIIESSTIYRNIHQTTAKKQKAVTYYKCPVLISYDVTVAVYHQLIQSEYYSSIIARFHGDDARKSLKNRAILIQHIPMQTKSTGQNVKSDDIAKKTINRISQNVLMCSAGGSYTETLITTESKIDELIATRPLAKSCG